MYTHTYTHMHIHIYIFTQVLAKPTRPTTEATLYVFKVCNIMSISIMMFFLMNKYKSEGLLSYRAILKIRKSLIAEVEIEFWSNYLKAVN